MTDAAWPKPLKLAELAKGPVSRRLQADAPALQRIAAELGLDGLDRLEAEAEFAPWLDGARVRGRLRAKVRQTCGVTLEPLESDIDHSFELALLPAGSPNAPSAPDDGVIDPEAEDPPDLIEGDQIDFGAIVIEELSLERSTPSRASLARCSTQAPRKVRPRPSPCSRTSSRAGPEGRQATNLLHLRRLFGHVWSARLPGRRFWGTRAPLCRNP